MTNLLFISAGERIGLIVVYILVAIGAVLIVKDVLIEFYRIFTNIKNHVKDYDDVSHDNLETTEKDEEQL
ncbi:MAG: hypothetical protein E7262_03415 [Lachnospiraceae bacterium]|nr:hypothetical protein [Lachnospiraceae bacterium]